LQSPANVGVVRGSPGWPLFWVKPCGHFKPMIVATQAPRGIHNQVVQNCTTQFFGKQNAPATINAAQEIIAASGGRADDLGKLRAGEFYFATDGSGRPGKVRTPICISFHPPNPPTPEEVIALAKAKRR
jgi:DNA helicase HerA-like ATPase